jgi:glycerophosphoryl diester phosphodiesterase
MSPVVRIAHAYGNSRSSLAKALSAEIDMIEVDCWYRAGKIYIHHERRLNPFPLLYDRQMKGHAPGPFAVRIGGWYLRPDIATIRLDELLGSVRGRKHILLDIKGNYSGRRVRDYARALERCIRSFEAEGWVALCGQSFPVLNAFRKRARDIEVRYSIEKPYQWESFLRKMQRDSSVRRVCIAYGFVDEEKNRLLEANRVNVYCWTVDDPGRAARLVRQGVDGIISNDLGLLEALGGNGAKSGPFRSGGLPTP